MQFPALGVQGWPLDGEDLFVRIWASFNHVPWSRTWKLLLGKYLFSILYFQQVFNNLTSKSLLGSQQWPDQFRKPHGGFFTGFPAARSGTARVNAALCSAALDHTSEGHCLWLNLSLGLESLAVLHTSKRMLAIIKLLHKLLLHYFIISLHLRMTDTFSKVNIWQGDLLVCVNTGKMRK